MFIVEKQNWRKYSVTIFLLNCIGFCDTTIFICFQLWNFACILHNMIHSFWPNNFFTNFQTCIKIKKNLVGDFTILQFQRILTTVRVETNTSTHCVISLQWFGWLQLAASGSYICFLPWLIRWTFQFKENVTSSGADGGGAWEQAHPEKFWFIENPGKILANGQNHRKSGQKWSATLFGFRKWNPIFAENYKKTFFGRSHQRDSTRHFDQFAGICRRPLMKMSRWKPRNFDQCMTFLSQFTLQPGGTWGKCKKRS